MDNRKACISKCWGQKLQRCLAMTVHTLHLSVKDKLEGSGAPLQAAPWRFEISAAIESWWLQFSEQNLQNAEEGLGV